MSSGSMVKSTRQKYHYNSWSMPESFDFNLGIPKAGKPQNQCKVAIQLFIFVKFVVSEFNY